MGVDPKLLSVRSRVMSGISRRWRVVGLACAGLMVVGCHKGAKVATHPTAPAVSYPSVADGRATIPQTETRSAVPQVEVRGRPVMTEVGLASWYGPPYSGRKGADGTVYDQNAMTAAHLTLPLGTMVRVTNLETGQSVMVRITDRGPFVHGRILDLSLAAAKSVGVYRAGVAKVRVEAFAAAPTPANVSTIPGGRWCVQIGAFMHQEDALSLKNDLMRRYTTAKVTEFAGPTGHWVRINPKFPDKGTAEQVAQSIHVSDAEAFLIRLD